MAAAAFALGQQWGGVGRVYHMDSVFYMTKLTHLMISNAFTIWTREEGTKSTFLGLLVLWWSKKVKQALKKEMAYITKPSGVPGWDIVKFLSPKLLSC